MFDEANKRGLHFFCVENGQSWNPKECICYKESVRKSGD